MTFAALTPSLHFCNQCGHALEQLVPVGDTRMRAVCPACSTIHYENPKCVVCTIPVYQNQVLLCLREIEPRSGFWTLPGGFLECGETMAAGAIRETWEEACARIELIEPVYSLIDIAHIAQIHLFFRANLQVQPNAPLFAAGEETLEAKLFALNDIPWHQLAFSSVQLALQSYVADAKKGIFTPHHHAL